MRGYMRWLLPVLYAIALTSSANFGDGGAVSDYIKPMHELLPYFLGAAMIATLAVVVIGIISFGVYGEFYRRNSNLLMRLRVVFQAVAVAILLVLTYVSVS